MKKIGIEAHTIEKIEKLGAGGTYLGNLLKEWSKLDPKKYQFILYFKERIPFDKFLDAPVFKKKIVKNPFNIKSTALFYNLSMPIAAKKDKIDILFLPFYMRPFFCFTPTITTIHDISFKVFPEWFSWNYKLPFRILTKLAIKKSLAIIVPSKYTKQEITKYYPSISLRASKIYPIYLAAGKRFAPKKHSKELKNKYLFYTATIFNRRHVLESIKAFKSLEGTCPELLKGYKFLISGRDFTRPAQNIDNQKGIKRIKYIDDKEFVRVYQNAELFVWLSEYEGFGLPVLEAMACGVPVLTTKMTSLGEVIGDYPLWVNNPNNVKEITEKMEKALLNKELREKMIKKGLERAKQFSWQKTGKETLKIISKYVENNTT